MNSKKSKKEPKRHGKDHSKASGSHEEPSQEQQQYGMGERVSATRNTATETICAASQDIADSRSSPSSSLNNSAPQGQEDQGCNLGQPATSNSDPQSQKSSGAHHDSNTGLPTKRAAHKRYPATSAHANTKKELVCTNCTNGANGKIGSNSCLPKNKKRGDTCNRCAKKKLICEYPELRKHYGCGECRKGILQCTMEGDGCKRCIAKGLDCNYDNPNEVHSPDTPPQDWQDWQQEAQEPAKESSPPRQTEHLGNTESFGFPQEPVPDYQDTYVSYEQPQPSHSAQMGQSNSQLPQVPHIYNSYSLQSAPAQLHLQQAADSYAAAAVGSSLTGLRTELPYLPLVPTELPYLSRIHISFDPPHHEPEEGAVAWIELGTHGSEWVYKDPNTPSRLGYFHHLRNHWQGWVDHIDRTPNAYEIYNYSHIFRDAPIDPIGVHEMKDDHGSTFMVYWAFALADKGHGRKVGSSKASHTKSSAGSDSRHGSERRGSHSSRASGTPRERGNEDSTAGSGGQDGYSGDNPARKSDKKEQSHDKGKEKSHR